MKSLISSLIIILLLASGTTVHAAQDSLPNDPLYGIKTFREDAMLAMTFDPVQRMNRQMELARNRGEEISMLVERKENIPEKTAQRLHTHLENALYLAAGQNEQEMLGSLKRIQTQLQTLEQTMLQLQQHGTVPSQAVLERARLRIQEQLRLINLGMVDPSTFRNQYRKQNMYSLGTPTNNMNGSPGAYGTSSSYGPGPNPSGTPAAGYGPNPSPSSSCTPIGGAGPGPYATPEPGPGPYSTPGPNPTNGPGPGPNPTDGPGPNPTDGPGPGPNPTDGPGPGPNSTEESEPGPYSTPHNGGN